MKNERVCIFNDEKYENEVLTGVPYTAELLQDLIIEFNQTVKRIPAKAPELAANELDRLIADPQGLFDERCFAIEVPAGLKREAYLKMVDIPDFTPVIEAWQAFNKAGYIDQALYRLEDGKIRVDESKLRELAESRNIYVKPGSPEHQMAEELRHFVKMLNKFDELTPDGFLNWLTKNTCRLNDIIDLVERPGSYTGYMAKFNPAKFRELIKRKPVTA